MHQHQAVESREDTIFLSMHGASLALQSNNADFLAYAREHLAALLSPPVEQPDIWVRLLWDQAWLPSETPVHQYRRLSRRLLLRENEIVQTEIPMLPGLQICSSLVDGRPSVVAAFRLPGKRTRWFPRSMNKPTREQIFAMLIYYLAYFPLLSHLERTRQWHPLHASAVAWPCGAVVLAGLGGVGKSTLTLAFLKDPLARLLSDNLLLHDGKLVYAFPEPIHLDTYSFELLGDVHNRLTSTTQTYSQNRRSYEVPVAAWTVSAVPRMWCALRQGEVLNLESIAPEQALEMALSSDLLAKELNEYAQQSAILNLLSPKVGSHQARITALHKLLTGIPCYDLVFRPGEALDRAVILVQETLAQQAYV